MTLPKYKKYHLATATKRMEKYLNNPSNRKFNFAMPQQEIEKDLKLIESDDLALYRIGLHLGDLAHWHSMNSVYRVVKNDKQGWNEVHQAMLYRLSEYRMSYFDLADNPPEKRGSRPFSENVALVIAHGLAVNDKKMADGAAEVLINGVPHGLATQETQISFEPFIVRLYGKLNKREIRVDFKKAMYGDYYVEMWEAWNDDSKLKAILNEFCDTHLTWAQPNSPKNFYRQFREPFEIYPLEIVAIQRVRRHLGLSTPTIDHPLMSSPLADAPESPPEVDDPILSKVLKRVREYLPKL
jgi:hypothetical protein